MVHTDTVHLLVETVADTDHARAIAVARAFDAHPALRPKRVGGDPARIRVEPSLEAIVAARDLPIDWLTLRESRPVYESGDITMLPGRGSWGGIQIDDVTDWSLYGNRVAQSWSADSVDDSAMREDILGLFTELVGALDATWGAVALQPLGGPSIWKVLPGVFWLNYFGPAFRTRFPGLEQVPGAHILGNGGILIATSEEPLSAKKSTPSARRLRRVFPTRAFRFDGEENAALPSLADHLAVAPGTTEMPWEAWEAGEADRLRTRRHGRARARLDRALATRDEPALDENAGEWSTALDLEDVGPFVGHLRRRLGGELAAPIGTALTAVITSASADEENAVVLDTRCGAIRFGWFMDDDATADITIWGAPDVLSACDDWFDG